MRSVIFTGPSLSPQEAQRLLPTAHVRGPAECGDVYSATKLRPSAIVLIDGYFDQRLSVWHKELLYAISRGIRVYGAASMGALRAAELHSYGMMGHGVIFEQFRTGELEDDDEVAVVHESQAHGYRSTSDALVNIRATLQAALAHHVIDSETQAALIQIAKQCFYPERSLKASLRRVAEHLSVETSALQNWLEGHGPVDQKRLDATSLLERVSEELSADSPKPEVRFAFERTNYFNLLERQLNVAAEPRSRR